MSFDLDLDTDKTISVIVSKDTAITGTEEDAYEKYLETLDEAYLNLQGIPTKFLMRKTLPYRDSKAIMNAQLTFEDNKPKVNVSFIMDEVRCALIGIEGSTTAFAKDTDGYCSKEIVNELYNRGVLMDLYNGRRSASGDGAADGAVKKS